MLNYNCIIKEDHSDIRKFSEDVKLPLSKEDEDILLSMNEYLELGYDPEAVEKYDIRPGVGLAAPQINVLKNMFVICAYDEEDTLFHFGVINPKIISHSEELTYLPMGEGCLSVTEENKGLVHRAKRIKVKFDLYDFESKEITSVTAKFKNYIAIVFQHEYDHLFGKLFIDRINKENPMHVPLNSSPIVFNEIEND